MRMTMLEDVRQALADAQVKAEESRRRIRSVLITAAIATVAVIVSIVSMQVMVNAAAKGGLSTYPTSVVECVSLAVALAALLLLFDDFGSGKVMRRESAERIRVALVKIDAALGKERRATADAESPRGD